MTNNEDIEKLLLSNLKSHLSRLYPSGKVEAGEFLIGDIHGSPGKSLKIRIKDGVWSDFSAGGSGKIFKFFAARHNGNFAKGMEEIRGILKLPPPIPQNNFKRPKKDWLLDVDETSKPMRYLINKRGLTADILEQCNVKYTLTEYVFVGIDEEKKLSYAQYINYKRGEDGKKQIRFSPKSKLCLWGMHSMQELNSDDYVIITEGVIDAMTFRMAGLFAVSIPSGIENTSWIEHSWQWLSQFSKIYICVDYDSAGQDKLNDISSRLGTHRCKRVILPNKDANEVLLSNPDDWIQLLNNSIVDSVDIYPKKRITAGSVRGLVAQYVGEGELMNQGDLLLNWQFPDTEFKKAINFRFRPGEQTIWTGYAGGGKSTMVFQHAAHCMFNLGQTVAIASLEEPFEKLITVIITQALGYHPQPDSEAFNKAYDVIQDKLIIFNVMGRADLDEVLEFFEFSQKKDGARHCILDSLMRTSVDIDGDKAKVNEMALKIINSTTRTQAHYHIVAHCVKGDDEKWEFMPTMASVKGIQELTANAHNVIVVWRNKATEASIEGTINKGQPYEAIKKRMDKGDTIVKIVKNRNGKRLGQLTCWFDASSNRFRPDYDISLDKPYLIINEDM